MTRTLPCPAESPTCMLGSSVIISAFRDCCDSASLTSQPVTPGWAACTGLPEQQWSLVDGQLANGLGDCLHVQPYCTVYSYYISANPAALSTCGCDWHMSAAVQGLPRPQH